MRFDLPGEEDVFKDPDTGYLAHILSRRSTPGGVYSHAHDGASDNIHYILGRPIFRRALAPGEMHLYMPDSHFEIGRRIPNSGDEWFLWSHYNILPEHTKPENLADVDMLKYILKQYPKIQPLLCPQSPDDVKTTEQQNYKSVADCHIKMAHFETWTVGFTPAHHSAGPDWLQAEGLEKLAPYDEFRLYFAFPVSLLGIHEAWSLISDTDGKFVGVDDIEEIVLDDAEDVQVGQKLWPPEVKTLNAILGRKVLDNSYLLHDRNLEMPAFGHASWPIWSRYWFDKDEPWPMPGELVCLVLKTMQFVVWWFQETQPFIYSGMWFETEFYSSGEVLEVFEPEPGSEEVVSTYRVFCKGEELFLKPTDFLEYEEGDRVAILKNADSTGKEPRAAYLGYFGTEDLQFFKEAYEDMEDDLKPHEKCVPHWWIAPITFYEDKDK